MEETAIVDEELQKGWGRRGLLTHESNSTLFSKKILD